MTNFQFRPAKRESIGLLIGLAGGTGSGKTMSALELATGMAGGKPFGLIDTEARRALHYAEDYYFEHVDLPAPFTPDRYLEAIIAADNAGFPVIVLDSASHEWAGDGGILDMQEDELQRMAGDDWKKRDACNLASWIKPKKRHKKFATRLLQLRAHLILCFRAEPKIEMAKEPGGKLVVKPKESLTGYKGWIPVCEKNLPFELTASFMFLAENPGVPLPIKLNKQHRPMFPTGEVVTREAGRLLAEWAAGGTPRPPAVEQPDATDDETLDKIAQTVHAFDAIGLKLADLEKHLGHPLETMDDVQALKRLYAERTGKLKKAAAPAPAPAPAPAEAPAQTGF